MNRRCVWPLPALFTLLFAAAAPAQQLLADNPGEEGFAKGTGTLDTTAGFVFRGDRNLYYGGVGLGTSTAA